MGQGLGQRPGHHGARALHAAAARRDARRVRARRDERRGHGRPPGALPDRPVGAPLLDRDAAARLRAGQARAPHAPGRDQRAGRDPRRRAPRGGVLRRRGGLDPLHPARVHARQAGRHRGAREPGPQARRAGQARPRRLGRHGRAGVPAHDRGDQPRGRVRQREDGRPGRGSTGPRRAPRWTCAPCCRRCAGRSPASGTRCWSSTRPRAHGSSSPRARRRSWSRSAPPAPTTSSTPSGCRSGSPSTPRARTRRRWWSASASGRPPTGTTTSPTPATTPRTPTPASC